MKLIINIILLLLIIKINGHDHNNNINDYHHKNELLLCNEKYIYGKCGMIIDELKSDLYSYDYKSIQISTGKFGSCMGEKMEMENDNECSDSKISPVRMVLPLMEWDENSKNPCRSEIAKKCGKELNLLITSLKQGGIEPNSISKISNDVHKCMRKNQESFIKTCESKEMETYLSGKADDYPIAIEIQQCMLDAKAKCDVEISNLKSDFHTHQMRNLIVDFPEFLQCLGSKTNPELKCTTKFIQVVTQMAVMHMSKKNKPYHGHDDDDDEMNHHSEKKKSCDGLKILEGEIIEREFYDGLGRIPHFEGWMHFIMIPIFGAFALLFLGCCCGRRCAKRRQLATLENLDQSKEGLEHHHGCDHHHDHHHHHHGCDPHHHHRHHHSKCHRIIHRIFGRCCHRHCHPPHMDVQDSIELPDSKNTEQPIVHSDIEYQNMKTDNELPIKNI